MAEAAPEVGLKNRVDQTMDELMCPLCISTFNQPRTLRCLHSYCESCLQRLVSANASKSRVLTCPECRAVTPLTAGGVKDLPINCKLKRIVEIITVGQCYNMTRKKSSVFSTSDIMCDVHQEKPLDYFCTSCEVVICITCVLEQHCCHKHVKNVNEVVEQHVKELEKNIPQMNEAKSNGELMLDSLKADLNIRKILNDKEKKIAIEMKTPVDQGHKKLQEHIARLTQALEGLGKSKQILEDALDKKSEDIGLLLEEKQLHIQIDAGIKHVEDEIFDSQNTDYKSAYPIPFVLDPDLKVQCSNFRYNTESSATRESSSLDPSGKGRAKLYSKMSPLSEIPEISYNEPSLSFGRSSKVVSFSRSSKILAPVFVIEAKGLTAPCNEKTPYPNSICCLTEDTYLVTDSRHHLFRIITSTGKFLQTVGSRGKGDGQFRQPTGIAIDNGGNVLVLDGKGSGCIQKFSTEGKFLSRFKVQEKNAAPYMEKPIDLVVLANGDILVTDSAKSCVHKFDASGKYNGVLENLMELKQPSGIAASEAYVVIADMANHCLFFLDKQMVFIRRVGREGAQPGELNIPYGVAFHNDGYIVVSESGNHRISVFAPWGKFVRCFGGQGSEKGKFFTPRQLCFNHHALLVVCDEENHRLQFFRDVV